MWRSLAVIFMLFALARSAWCEEQQQPYKFGVFPYLSAARLEPIYSPVSFELGKALNRQVNFRTASTFKRFFSKLKQQQYDIALIQPFWYPPAVDQFDYVPLLRLEEEFVSLIMVLQDSPINTVDDLKGKVIASPPAFVPVAHMARRYLAEHGLRPDKDVRIKAFKSVDSCFQQIIIGNADACITPPFAPALIEDKMQVKLRQVVRTPSIPNLSLVALSSLPESDRGIIKQLFLSWRDSDEGQKLLQGINTRGFVPARDAEYDVVRTFLSEIAQQNESR